MINYWHNSGLSEHANVDAHIQALPSGTPLRISVVTLGEVHFGHRSVSKPAPAKQAALDAFIQAQFPEPLPISRHTAGPYGHIRSLLFSNFAPKSKRRRRPEDCLDPITARELGIDENDLWIAAQAVEHNLILVTNDGMSRIRSVTASLLDIEDWTLPP